MFFLFFFFPFSTSRSLHCTESNNHLSGSPLCTEPYFHRGENLVVHSNALILKNLVQSMWTSYFCLLFFFQTKKKGVKTANLAGFSILKSSRQDELKLIGGKMKHFKVHLWSSENWNKHRDLFNYLWLWDLFCGNHSTQSTCSLCPDPIRPHKAKPSVWIGTTVGESTKLKLGLHKR